MGRSLEELKTKGWFSPELKKQLPKYPKTIGVVTSPTGSVIQDIIHVLRRRFPQFHLILNPVRVQGEGAAAEIAGAIDDFNRHSLADILIVGRGGGSLEDLWPFNERVVAEAIFNSKIPVISAVGHETDVTIADCVADVRAPTPSAAAEVSVRELSAQKDFLREVTARIEVALKQTIKHARAQLEGIVRAPVFATPHTLLTTHFLKIDEVTGVLDRTVSLRIEKQRLELLGLRKQLLGLQPETQFKQIRAQLSSYVRAINAACKHLLEKKGARLTYLTKHLSAVNPENILQKGYCIPFAEKDHSVMLSARGLKEGMRIHLQFHDGSAKSRIEEVSPKNNGIN